MTTAERTRARTRIRRRDARLYEVQSQSSNDDFHVYDLDTHTCTCKAGQEGRYCWHWGAAKEADEFYAHWRACHGRDPQGCYVELGTLVPGGADGLRELFQ